MFHSFTKTCQWALSTWIDCILWWWTREILRERMGSLEEDMSLYLTLKKKIKKNEDIYLERKRESNNISSHLIHNVLHLIFASWKWGEEKSSTWWGKYDITIHISNSINPTPFSLHYCPILHCHLNIDKDITPFSIFHLFFSLLFSSH